MECFETEGTFTRLNFIDCCRQFALNERLDAVEVHPGRHSVWILDGAAIYCDPSISLYLQSIGIIPIFLSAYCPFFNPIEYLFGFMKSYMRRYYAENGSSNDMKLMIAQTNKNYKDFYVKAIFKLYDMLFQNI